MDKFNIVKSYYVNKGNTLYRVEIIEPMQDSEFSNNFYAVISNEKEEFFEEITDLEKADFEVEQYIGNYVPPNTMEKVNQDMDFWANPSKYK